MSNNPYGSTDVDPYDYDYQVSSDCFQQEENLMFMFVIFRTFVLYLLLIFK